MARGKGAVRVSITGESAGLERATRRADQSIGKLGRDGSKHFGRLAKAAAGAATALVGIAEAKKAVSVTEDLAKATIGLNKNLGLSVQRASEWAAVAKTRGIETKALNTAFGTLAKNSLKAAEGGKAQADAFARLGVTQKELKSLNFNQLLGEAADGLGKMAPGATKTATAMQLFGRGWQTVLPVLREGSKGMAEQLALARKYGATFSGGTVKSMKDFIAAQREAKFASMGLQIAFATQVAPALTKVIGGMARFTANLRSGNGTAGRFAATVSSSFNAIKGAVGSVSNSVSAFMRRNRGDINQFGKAVSNVWSAVRNVAQRIWPGIRQIVQGSLRSLGGYVKVFSGLFTGDFRKMWQGVKQIFSGGLKSIGGQVRAATASMRAAGAALVRGLINGLKSLPGAIANAGKDLGRSVLNAVKDFLGIKSPSRAFVDVGKNIVAGLSRGLDAGDAVSVVKKHFGGLAGLAAKLVQSGALKATSIPVEGLKKLGSFGAGQIGKLVGGQSGIVSVGRQLQRMGFQVGEHPSFGGVAPVHTKGSYHYSGRAIDVNWPNAGQEPGKLDAVYRMLKGLPHKELLWRTKGHFNHLHFAMQRGGMLPGRGDGDKVLVSAEPGEGFINKRAVAAMGGSRAIDAINSMVPRFARGGGVKKAKRNERAFHQGLWGQIAPLLGQDPKRRVPSLFKHYSMSGKSPWVGVAWDPGEEGKGRPDLLWPSWLFTGKDKLPRLQRTQLFIHEMAHRFQNPKQTPSAWTAEGGAEAFARWGMRRIGLKTQGSGMYLKDARRAVKEKGWPWVQHGQFMQRGGVVGRFASGGVVVKAARAAGFKGANLLRAVAEAKAESGWNERAVGDGGKSKGLMQIHTGWNPWAKRLNLFNPGVNMKAAMRVFKSQGWGAFHANHVPEIGAARRAIAGSKKKKGWKRFYSDGSTPGATWVHVDPLAPKPGKLGPPAPPEPGEVGEVGGGVEPNQALADAMAEANRIAEERNRLLSELDGNQKRLIHLTTRQGPQLLAALVAAVSGDIGGTLGLGAATPGYAGMGVGRL